MGNIIQGRKAGKGRKMLADLIYEYMAAKSLLDEARSTCDSSWGHWLYDESEKVDRLAEQIENYHVNAVQD